MSIKEKCPICGEGNLLSRVGRNAVSYKGRSEEINLYFSECDCCGCEQAAPAELRKNKKEMALFKKRVDGFLTGAQIRAFRRKLRITQKEAAKIFGGGPVAFSKYESDSVVQSGSMDKLIRIAMEVPAAWEKLCALSGMKARLVDLEVDSSVTEISYSAKECAQLTPGPVCLVVSPLRPSNYYYPDSFHEDGKLLEGNECWSSINEGDAFDQVRHLTEHALIHDNGSDKENYA